VDLRVPQKRASDVFCVNSSIKRAPYGSVLIPAAVESAQQAGRLTDRPAGDVESWHPLGLSFSWRW